VRYPPTSKASVLRRTWPKSLQKTLALDPPLVAVRALGIPGPTCAVYSVFQYAQKSNRFKTGSVAWAVTIGPVSD
jgi:hypothetical protein